MRAIVPLIRWITDPCGWPSWVRSAAVGLLVITVQLLVVPSHGVLAQEVQPIMYDTTVLADQTDLTLPFTVYNSEGLPHTTVTLSCYTIGSSLSDCVAPLPFELPVGPGSEYGTRITVRFKSGSPGSGQVVLAATTAWGSGSGYYNVAVVAPPPPPHYAVVVTPKGDSGIVPAGGNVGVAFSVHNTGETTTTFALTAACTGSAFPTGCSVLPSSANIAPDSITRAIVFWTAGASGTTGRIKLTASQTSPSGSASDTGWTTVRALTLTAGAPRLDVASVNPGAAVARDRCLTINAGREAAWECGDLRITHPLPAVRTRNRTWAPTLLYNSQLAHPQPVVVVHITQGDSTLRPDTVVAVLKVNSTTRDSLKLAALSFWPGTTRRLAFGYDALTDPTGVYPYTVTVQYRYNSGGVVKQSTATGSLIVVNRSTSVSRSASPFGSGWWLTGLEQLLFPSSDTTARLWVGGDGSARLYAKVASNVWAAPNVDRPDTLKWDGTSYVRYLPHGVRVKFNALGQHVATVTRLGDSTSFHYTASGLLDTLRVPPSGGPYYAFMYSGLPHQLDSISAPGPTGTGRRRTALTRNVGIVTGIRDLSTRPESTYVSFGYSDTAGRVINARTDRNQATTTYGYGPRQRLASMSLDMGPGQAAIVTRFRDADSLGLGGARVDIAAESAYVRINGPRRDTTVTKLWLDRYGQPTKVQDALGYITTITHGSSAWPSLATRVQYPNGRVLGATYDARGNVATVTDSSHYDATRQKYATTSYQWDQKWDFLVQTTRPEGEVSLAAYATTTGNRLWQQDGALPDTSRRVHFGYYTSGFFAGLLAYVRAPLDTAADSVTYDAQFANLSGSRTPLGYWTYYLHDNVGRLVRTAAPINATDSLVDSVAYDPYDRDTLKLTFGKTSRTGVQQDSLRVRMRYDAEGHLGSLFRMARPDPNNIGEALTTFAYDPAGRKTEETSPIDSLNRGAEKWRYDAAGNVIAWTTRRGYTITSKYDPLDRLTERIVPSSAPDSISIVYYSAPGVGTWAWNFPLYPDPGKRSLAIPEDVATYRYDSVGNVVSAYNGDARIERTYYPYGALKTDELAIRTWKPLAAGGNFSTHVYRSSFTYDLNSRRTTLAVPANIAPRRYADATPLTTISYTYNTVTGDLAKVSDPLGNMFTYHYNARGQVDSIGYPGTVGEKLSFDGQGRLARRVAEGAYISANGGVLHDDVIRERDMQDRLLRVRTIADSVTNKFTLLGALLQTRSGSAVYDSVYYGDWQTDALGRRISVTTRTSQAGGPLAYYTRLSAYEPLTGRLIRTTNSSSPYDYLEQLGADNAPQPGRARAYDASGNIGVRVITPLTSSGTVNGKFISYSFYGADERPRVFDQRKCIANYSNRPPCQPVTALHHNNAGVYEEYRYDALGRRVLVRTRRDSTCRNPDRTCQSTIDRVIWDGEQILAEIRMPGADTISAADLERDTTTVVAQFAPFGRVTYVHGRGLDRPLAIIRNGYSYYGYGTSPDPVFSSWSGAIAVIPHTSWRGVMDIGTFSDGKLVHAVNGPMDTSNGYCRTPTWPTGAIPVCVTIDWPESYLGLFGNSSRNVESSWFGSLVREQTDGSGQQYKRNRYYDPLNGQFTQEDPIGLAGGLNLYGYANGDPVNFSDPFGLCTPAVIDCPVTIGIGVGVIAKGLLAIGASVGAGYIASRPTGSSGALSATALAAPVAADMTAVASHQSSGEGKGRSSSLGGKARRAIGLILIGGGLLAPPSPEAGDATQTGAGGRTDPASVEQPADDPRKRGDDKRKKKE